MLKLSTIKKRINHTTMKKTYLIPQTICVALTATAYVLGVTSGQGPGTGDGPGSGNVG